MSGDWDDGGIRLVIGNHVVINQFSKEQGSRNFWGYTDMMAGVFYRYVAHTHTHTQIARARESESQSKRTLSFDDTPIELLHILIPDA